MNWLDKAIGWLDPEIGLKRVRSRHAMNVMSRHEGARRNRRNEGWGIKGGSPNEDIKLDLATLRARSRDLVRNNPYASRVVEVWSASLIGEGILPKFDAGDDSVKNAWADFSAQADFDGRTDFNGLQELIARTMVESGEALVIFRPRSTSSGLKVPLQLQVLEPDYLDELKNIDNTDGSFIFQGIEYNALGQRVAYWLHTRHPGDLAYKTESRRIPAEDVIHLYALRRPGQSRGIPWMTPILQKLKDLDDYDEAELFAKKLQACFAAFITVTGGEDGFGPLTTGTAPDGTSERREKLQPGMMARLNPGEDVKFATPPVVQGSVDYLKKQQRDVAIGAGVMYEQLTGDLGNVNYSSFRAGHITFRSRCEQLRYNLIIPGLCIPVMKRFLNTAIAAGQIQGEPERVEWTPPRYYSIDPEKDFRAALIAVRSGQTSLPTAIAENGYDPQEVLNEIAKTNELLDSLGLVLDSDPRKVALAGTLQQQTNTDPISN